MYLKTPSNKRIRNYFKKTFKRLERDLIVCSINWDFLCIIALFLVSFEIKKSWKNKKRIIQRSKKKERKMEQRKLLNVDDFLSNPKKAFILMGWNPFDGLDYRSCRWSFILRSFYMFITNFYIIFGFVLIMVYSFVNINEPGAFLKITDSAPTLGK